MTRLSLQPPGRFVALALLSGLMTGCLSNLHVSPRAESEALLSRCHSSPPVHRAATHAAPSVPHVSHVNLTSQRTPLSMEAQETAARIGVLTLLDSYPVLQEHLGDRHTIFQLVRTRQEISRHIAMVVSDVMMAMQAIDCEAGRANHVADAVMEAQQDASERALFAVFASDIWIGIISGALMLSGHEIVAAANEIFGGVLAIGVGSADMVFQVRQEFQHPQNVLRELLEAPIAPRFFPASVWSFLNSPSEEDQTRTSREILINRWHAERRLGEPGTDLYRQRHALFFGDGGLYGHKELRIRAEMLGHLKSEVLRIRQALHGLKYEVTQWLDSLRSPLAAIEP